MPDQAVVRRPPDCRLRLDVGSDKAYWRQPTCAWCAGYNGAYTALRGIFLKRRVFPSFFQAHFSFCCYHSKSDCVSFSLHIKYVSVIMFKHEIFQMNTLERNDYT